ncbi:protein of unknown function (plasmid) [Azospirillum lipoferum 4B]|uniref:Uncharacterized protein n=1 Tax=Azospirillum lipoferum (strain 4B) TaxID=862719 RepID=G7ZD46_AZOL4|nr:protein of unknown function [Azospirillum lipoferum 4B]
MTASAHLLRSGKAARPPPQSPPPNAMGFSIGFQRQSATLPDLDMTAPRALKILTRHPLTPLSCDQRNIS